MTTRARPTSALAPIARRPRPASARAGGRGAPALVAALLLVGCGLVPADPIDFRSYPLHDTTYAEAEAVVRDVTARWFTSRMGGMEVTWDDEQRNMEIDVTIETRKLDLMIHLVELPDGAEVEMLALVRHAIAGAVPPRYGEPQMDVFLEQTLHQAWVDELRARRAGLPTTPR